MLDPHLTPEQLQQLAATRPDLYPLIAQHPQCPPQLAGWLRQHISAQGEPAGGVLPHIQSAAPGAPSMASTGASQNMPQPPQGGTTTGGGATPSGKKKRKKKSPVITVLVSMVVIMALVLGGLVVWIFTKNPSLADGVKKVNEQLLPDDGVVVASAADDATQTIYSLAIFRGDDTPYTAIISKKEGEKPKVNKKKLDKDVKTALDDPDSTLCSAVKALSCKKALKAKKARLKFKDYDYHWDENTHVWKNGKANCHAHTLFGVQDGYLIGTQEAPQYAGNTRYYSALVPSITLFDATTCEPLWRKVFERPSYVVVIDDVISVWEGDPALSEEGNDPVEQIINIIDNNKRRHTYELIADNGKENLEKPYGNELPEEDLDEPEEEDSGADPEGMRSIDITNSIVPGELIGADPQCSVEKFMQPHEIPNEEQNCWVQLQNGSGVSKFSDWNEKITLRTDTLLYGDFNDDGYDDVAVMVNADNSTVTIGPTTFVWIYNPEKPDTPSIVVGGQGTDVFGGNLQFTDGELQAVTNNGCVGLAWKFTGSGSTLQVSEPKHEDIYKCEGL
ncbi:MAG: hypothetical protein Q4P66_08315 [Actinomycetaceae bacterium]|nr:hypothetical protein [Actinomycetaceae bacterium]